MITCEICGKVFVEQDWKEFNLHNTVKHLHDYRGVSNYHNPIPYIRHTKEAIEARDRLIEYERKMLEELSD